MIGLCSCGLPLVRDLDDGDRAESRGCDSREIFTKPQGKIIMAIYDSQKHSF